MESIASRIGYLRAQAARPVARAGGRTGVLAVALILAGGIAGPARAADLGGACCLDLEERIAELEAMDARKGGRKVSLTVSGLVSWPIMVWDDGQQTGAYIVTNDVKRPRLRFDGAGKIDDRRSAGYVLEIGPQPPPGIYPMDQHAFIAATGFQEVRMSYFWMKDAQLGQVSLGLQSQATDNATEVTLANTGMVVTPGLPLMLGYVKRGFLMRRDDGVLTTMRFGDLLLKGRTDIWGEGHRWNVVRYDTPVIGGFSFAVSWGEDNAKDAALRYAGDWGRLRVSSAIGVAKYTDGDSPNIRGCAFINARNDVDCWEVGGSVALMDMPTGLFLNAAAGYGKDENVHALYNHAPGVDDDETFYYLVGGIERQWLDIGKTTLFGQYWHKNVGAGVLWSGVKVDATPLGAQPYVSGADVTIYGASIVQSLADGVDVYASLNRTETEVRTSATGGKAGSVVTGIQPFDFVFGGLAIRF